MNFGSPKQSFKNYRIHAHVWIVYVHKCKILDRKGKAKIVFNNTKLRNITNLIGFKSANVGNVVIGIDGLSGAGKSTLAQQIVDSYENAIHIELDDFYRPYHATKGVRLSPKEICFRLFDWERLRNDLLAPIAKGRAAIYQRYDWVENRLLEQVEIPVSPIIVVEGVFGMLPALRTFYNLKIYVETPENYRLGRINARGYPDRRWLNPWMAAENWYIQEIKPKDYVDLVISGSTTRTK